MNPDPENIETTPTEHHGPRIVDLSKPLLPDWPLDGSGGWSPIGEAETVFHRAPQLAADAQAAIQTVYSDTDLTIAAKRRRADAILATIENEFLADRTRVQLTEVKGREAAESLETVVHSYAIDDATEARFREQRELFRDCSEQEQHALIAEAIQRGDRSDVEFLRSLIGGPRGFRHGMGPEIKARAVEVVAKAVEPGLFSRSKSFPIASDFANESIRASKTWLNDWLDETDRHLEKINLDR